MERSKRNLSILVVGQLASVLCTFIFDFAISLYVLDQGNAESQFSIVIMIGMIGRIIVNLFGGVFVDKGNKKTMIVLSDFLSGGAVLIGFLLLQNKSLTIAAICILTFFLNGFNSFFSLSFMASVPRLFESEKEIMMGNSVTQSIQAVSAIFGPILGALLYSNLGMGFIIILNFCSFIFTGLLEMFLLFSKKIEEERKEASMWEEFKQGFQFVKSKGNIKNLCIFYTFFQMITQPLFLVLLPIIAYDRLALGSRQLGIIQAGYAVGVLVGAGLASSKKDMGKILQNMFKIIGVQGVVVALWAVVNLNIIAVQNTFVKTAVLTVLVFVFSVLTMYVTVPLVSYFQIQIPENMRGKMFGIISTALTIGAPVGSVILGAAVANVSWMWTVILSGMVLILLAILFQGRISFAEEKK